MAGSLGAGTARQNLLAGINAGQLLVNYNGHGSVEIWGGGLFDDTAASSLTNGSKLPVFVAMLVPGAAGVFGTHFEF